MKISGVSLHSYLLQEVALEVDEVVGLDDVGAALAAEHSGEQRLHGRRALPRAHHGVGYLQSFPPQQINGRSNQNRLFYSSAGVLADCGTVSRHHSRNDK